MTWDELLGKIREGLHESGACLQVLRDLLANAGEDNEVLDYEQTNSVVVGLVLVASNLHSAVEHVGIGLDALAEVMRKASNSQEVKRD